MKKISFDTNILLRYFQNDKGASIVERYLLSDEYEIYICDLVLTEIVFSLKTYYDSDRLEISEFLYVLIQNKNVKINKNWLLECLEIFKSHPSISFVDIAAYVYAKNDGNLPLYSFDKALQKYDSKNILELK